MNVLLGSDHRGVTLRALVKGWVEAMGHGVVDLGPAQGQTCDYPDNASLVCHGILERKGDVGLLICGTGVGMCIAANRFPEIRAVVCSEPFSAAMARRHNHCNVLCLGASVVGEGMAEGVVRAFFEASFEGGRHTQRVHKLGALP